MPGAERPVQRRVRAVDQQSPRQPAVPQLQSVEAEPDPPDLTGALAADLRQRCAGGGDRVERTGTTVAFEVVHRIEEVGENPERLTDLAQLIGVLRAPGDCCGGREDPAG